jgi:hypothetical protein
MRYKSLIYANNTMQLDIAATIEVLNLKFKHIHFEKENVFLHLPDCKVKIYI